MRRCRFAVVTWLVAACGCAIEMPENTPRMERREIDPVSQRAYWIYVSSRYRAGVPSPLIVSCHGTPPYDIANHHVREWKMLGEENNCIVLAPELIATDGLIGDGPVVGMIDDERFILSMISQLSYRYNIDRGNVMITGFSGGGFPTYWVGMRHPDIFTAVVARSSNFSEHNLDGWYPPEARSQSIKVYYTQNDPVTIRAQSEGAVRYLRSKGFTVETEELPGLGHQRRPQVAMEFFLRERRPSRPSIPAE